MVWLLSLSMLTGRNSEKTEPEACCGYVALGQEAADLYTGKPTWIVGGVFGLRIFFLLPGEWSKHWNKGPKKLWGLHSQKFLHFHCQHWVTLSHWPFEWGAGPPEVIFYTQVQIPSGAASPGSDMHHLSLTPGHFINKSVTEDNSAISDNQYLSRKRTNTGRQARLYSWLKLGREGKDQDIVAITVWGC